MHARQVSVRHSEIAADNAIEQHQASTIIGGRVTTAIQHLQEIVQEMIAFT